MAEVYWAYVGLIEAYVRRFAKPFEVPDLVQEVFTRAFVATRRLAYDETRDYAPYLVTIARNLLVDGARHAGREQAVDTTEFADLPAAETDVEPWADPQVMRLVEGYLKSLPAPLQAVHDVRYVQGLPQRDAAARIGISRQQLRTREAQIREGLAAKLREFDAGTTEK